MSTSTLPARRSSLAVIRGLREAKARGQNPAADVSSRMALAEALEPRQLLTVTGAVIGPPTGAVEANTTYLYPFATTDHDPAPTYWTIKFGDGTSESTSVNGNASIAHTYSFMGTYTATAQVSDTSTGGSYYYCSTSVTVADAAILPYGGSYTTAISATEGADVDAVVARFTDGNPYKTAAQFGATVDFGDGTSSAFGTIVTDTGGGFDVVALHTFAEFGSYSGTVSIHDNETASLTMSLASTVADATITGTGHDVSFTEDSGDGEVSDIVASFVDSNTATSELNDMSALIHWGDGSTSDGFINAIDGSPGSYNVLGSHDYTATGSYTVTTDIADVGGEITSPTSTAAAVSSGVKVTSDLKFNLRVGNIASGVDLTAIDLAGGVKQIPSHITASFSCATAGHAGNAIDLDTSEAGSGVVTVKATNKTGVVGDVFEVKLSSSNGGSTETVRVTITN